MIFGGLTEDEIDVSEVDATLHGCWFQAVTQPRSSLEQLATAFQLEFVEVDGKVKALQRPHTAVAVIPYDDLGSYQEGRDQGQAPRLQMSRRQDQEIARRVEVTYHDIARNYEPNTQGFGREVYGGDSVATISLQLALDADTADRIAKIEAITAWTERMPVQFTLPSDYLWLSPGDVVTITTPAGATLDIHIAEMEFPAPGVITIKGARQIAEAYDQDGEGDPGQGGPVTANTVYAPDDTDLWLSHVPALVDADSGTTGFYAAGAPMGNNETWEGFTLYRQLGDEGQYQALLSATAPATIGRAVTQLAAGSGVDQTNTVDVELTNGTLASITQDDFDATETVNLCVLGGEAIQFRDVTRPDPEVRPNLYRLSYLDRGLRSTSGQAGSHQISERFVLVDAAVRRVQINANELGTTYQFKAVTFGQDVDDALSVAFTPGG
jgi:hypothetical protein